MNHECHINSAMCHNIIIKLFSSTVLLFCEFHSIFMIIVVILSECLVSNVTVELYFIMQLLTCKGGELHAFVDIAQNVDDINYFASVHNAVYFAVKVLSLQQRYQYFIILASVLLSLKN